MECVQLAATFEPPDSRKPPKFAFTLTCFCERLAKPVKTGTDCILVRFMVRKLILFGAALAVLSPSWAARGAILLSDSFNYTNGALVTVSTNWVHHSGSVTGEVQVISGRLLISQNNSEDV